MLAVEDVLCELAGREDINEQGLPPGFRFHPTDEELITYYLASKVFNGTFCGVDIAEVDLNRCEPWELPEGAKMGEREWYFFSLRDRKYPTGLRTNRATGAGYWKATGKDREVYSSSSSSASTASASASASALLGMKKTLVFYKGRAPRGEKTKWVMHEYRLDGDFSYRHTCKEEWVICRIFHKTMEKKKNPIFQGQSYFLEASSSPPTNNSSSCLTPTALLELVECPQSHHPTMQMQMQMQMKSLHHQQNPFLMIQQQEEDDLKSIINPPIVSQNNLFPININGFQLPSFSPTPTTIKTSSRSTTSTATTITSTNKNSKDTENNIPSSAASMLFKSLLSHQQQHQQQQQANNSIPKQCKTEASFSHFQLPDASANLHWVDKIHHHHQQQQQNPSSFQYHHHHHNNNNSNPSSLFFEMDCNTSVFHQAVDQSNTSVHEMSTSIAAAFNNRTDFQMILDPPIIKLPGESWPLNP